jgi:N-acetylmuramoyl-L-alanine amidase
MRPHRTTIFHDVNLRHTLGRAMTALAAVAALALTGCATGVKNTTRTFRTVVIDAGHGGTDLGATKNGIIEKHVALDVARHLEKHLRREGFKTVMTRRDDRFIPLNTRAAISNRQSNAVFVSVHFNYAKRRGASGAEVFYRNPASRPLAVAVSRQLDEIAEDRGVRTANFRVLKRNHFPAILVECGFVTNRAEAKKIRDPGYRERLADAIADGLLDARGALPRPEQPAATGPR